ncbi:MAG: hypothetical protein K0V04_16440 [Deltaproteobacteria bacterium]|nr:hypothetical protein [Deltaproteobacteria bacterium]
MSAPPSLLLQLYRGLEALYQTETGVDPESLVIRRPAHHGPREQLLMREADDGDLEVALVFDTQMLARFEDGDADEALADDNLGVAIPVVEGLSHLMYLAEAARRGRPVSGLELETQAEVDKLGLCLLHRWPDSRDHFDRLVDRLYYRFELHPMSPSLARRYDTANRLALGFSRRLRPHVETRRLPALRRALRQFWGASMQDKRTLAQTEAA